MLSKRTHRKRRKLVGIPEHFVKKCCHLFVRGTLDEPAVSKSLAAIAARSAIQPSSQTQPMPPYSLDSSDMNMGPACPDIIEPKWLTATHDGHEIHPLHHFCTTLTPFLHHFYTTSAPSKYNILEGNAIFCFKISNFTKSTNQMWAHTQTNTHGPAPPWRAIHSTILQGSAYIPGFRNSAILVKII